MIRAKTLVGHRYGVRHQHAGNGTLEKFTTFEEELDDEASAESAARDAHARCKAQKRGCKFVRAKCYRLAPLVVLKLTRATHERALVVLNDGKELAKIEIDAGDDDEENFEAFVYGDDHSFGLGREIIHSMVFESSTLDDVVEWVGSHLRPLGFKLSKKVPT